MKIIELQAENVKRIRAVTIRPDGNVVTISGENGQGKSSCLDAIAYALGGKEMHPPEVIRRGEERASVVVDLGEIVVHRKWTRGGTSLVVEAKDGSALKSPQAVLDKLVGELTFNPVAFLALRPAEQVETLKRLVGVDTTKLEAERAAVVEERSGVIAAGKALRARLDSIGGEGVSAPDEPVSIVALLAEQGRMQDLKRANDSKRADVQLAVDAYVSAASGGERARAAIASIERDLAAARLRLSEADERERATHQAMIDAKAAAGALVDPDIGAVTAKIAGAEGVNAAVRVKKERAGLDLELKTKRQQKGALDKKVEALDSARAKLMREAKFPVPGLSFGPDGIALEGIPLEQASSAEQLRVSVAMALALNPKLRVVFIRDGSLLDKKSLAMVATMAAEADAQVWVEVVASGGVGVEIVDGQVAAGEVHVPATANGSPRRLPIQDSEAVPS